MEIIVNGEAWQVEDALRIATLLDMAGFGGRRVAVEVNLDIVPRSAYHTHVLHDGDRVEIVQAIGGGCAGVGHDPIFHKLEGE